MTARTTRLFIIVLAPFGASAIGLLIIYLGFGISRLHDPIGEMISLGGVYVAPLLYGAIACVRTRVFWVGVVSALLGFLGTYLLAYVLIGPYAHHAP